MSHNSVIFSLTQGHRSLTPKNHSEKTYVIQGWLKSENGPLKYKAAYLEESRSPGQVCYMKGTRYKTLIT